MKRFPPVFLLPVATILMVSVLMIRLFAEDDPAPLTVEVSTNQTELLIPTNGTIPLDLGKDVSKSPDFWTGKQVLIDNMSVFIASNHIVAYYGHPHSKKMGILGRYPIPEMTEKLEEAAMQFDITNGDRGIVPAYYIIYGTCQPGGEIGLLGRAVVEKYIQYAQSKGYLVFLDHQIGKYSVEESMRKLLPFLKYPNVHLAIDPEWRTLKPMQEIGSITAAELNQAQKIMQEYMQKNKIPGKRMLVVHQFNVVMIKNRPAVRADYDPVTLIHCMDGFGSPQLKKSTYQFNALAKNMPIKSFKLFYRSGYRGAGYDMPLMSPAEVLALKPEPFLIMYQ